MRVNVITGSANHPHYRDVLERFAASIPNSIVSEAYTPSDVAVIFGSWKPRPARHHAIKNQMLAAHDGPFLVLETPLIGRRIETEYDDYRIGINHFLRGLGDFNNKNRPPDRWELLKKKFNIDLAPYRVDGDHIVVALQLPGDASLMGKDISEWAVETVDALRAHTQRPIVIRPHKLVREYNMDLITACVRRHRGVEFYDPIFSAGRDDLVDAWASVSYTSGYGVDSLIRGVPAFTMHRGNHATPCSQPLENIESPTLVDRTQWVSDLSYAQWSVDEISTGAPWVHLEPRLCQYLP